MSARWTRTVLVLAALCLGNAEEDAVDRVASALQQGSQSHAAQHAAAAVLAATGAQPLEGTRDLQTVWSRRGDAVYRNRALGPAYRLIELGGGEEAHFEQTFLAGQRAHVAISEPGGDHFALTIEDETGQSQCTTTGRDCSWMPLWTARFRIVVRNRSGQRGRTFLVLQ
ncbi:hypothetical protein [Novosphingobium sp.]|uniref:hypothetical protein n=1 Tax=Novosphingobium sp. TaxID=1874826 RepID=UPI003BAD3D6E